MRETIISAITDTFAPKWGELTISAVPVPMGPVTTVNGPTPTIITEIDKQLGMINVSEYRIEVIKGGYLRIKLWEDDFSIVLTIQRSHSCSKQQVPKC